MMGGQLTVEFIESDTVCRITFKLVQKCNQVLDWIGRNNGVASDWVPEHSGIPRNDRADSLTRDAVLMPRNGKGIPERLVGVTHS
jgi:ribonuclease HI